MLYSFIAPPPALLPPYDTLSRSIRLAEHESLIDFSRCNSFSATTILQVILHDPAWYHPFAGQAPSLASKASASSAGDVLSSPNDFRGSPPFNPPRLVSDHLWFGVVCPTFWKKPRRMPSPQFNGLLQSMTSDWQASPPQLFQTHTKGWCANDTSGRLSSLQVAHYIQYVCVCVCSTRSSSTPLLWTSSFPSFQIPSHSPGLCLLTCLVTGVYGKNPHIVSSSCSNHNLQISPNNELQTSSGSMPGDREKKSKTNAC